MKPSRSDELILKAANAAKTTPGSLIRRIRRLLCGHKVSRHSHGKIFTPEVMEAISCS